MKAFSAIFFSYLVCQFQPCSGASLWTGPVS